MNLISALRIKILSIFNTCPNKPHIPKKELQTYRKELRKKLTPAEAFLWTQLKSRQLENKRFTKQHSISNYIVDFYCASEKLIIELDGQVHFTPEAQECDIKRTKYLESLGNKVIRFENKMVFDHLSSVIKEIRDCFDKPSASSPLRFDEPPPFN